MNLKTIFRHIHVKARVFPSFHQEKLSQKENYKLILL